MAAIRGSGFSRDISRTGSQLASFFSGMARFAAHYFQKKKILPAALPNIAETSGFGLLHSLQGLRTGCFFERSKADRRELPSSGIET